MADTTNGVQARPKRTTVPVSLKRAPGDAHKHILTNAALTFVAELHRRFEPRRRAALAQREELQRRLDNEYLPDFNPATQAVRDAEWKVAPIPPDLEDRRVEITGPVDRKTIINALNSGANVFMADFEDSHCPTWSGTMDGQVNLYDAVRRTITYTSEDGKLYALNPSVATLMVRPRGWHLVEKHMRVDGEPVSASLFDFGLFFFHNAIELSARGSGPYFYLPKLEHHREARLWNDVFRFSQEYLGIPNGTIRATVLIENILAAFQMDEILWCLREHSAGLNCGRWDYIFSFIKKFRSRAEFVLPDRGQITMDRHFLASYVDLLIHTCHRRGIHAMGGMAAQIPVRNDPRANTDALEKVLQDKLREVCAGHDGTWVAHPGLVPVARQAFDEGVPGPNQIHFTRDDVDVCAADLLTIPKGRITEEGLRHNIDVGIQYVEAWLSGTGCVPIYHLMEDAATAEISRSQVWQWIYHWATVNEQTITPEMVTTIIEQEVAKIERTRGNGYDGRCLRLAADMFRRMVTSPVLDEWLPVIAYDLID